MSVPIGTISGMQEAELNALEASLTSDQKTAISALMKQGQTKEAALAATVSQQQVDAAKA